MAKQHLSDEFIVSLLTEKDTIRSYYPALLQQPNYTKILRITTNSLRERLNEKNELNLELRKMYSVQLSVLSSDILRKETENKDIDMRPLKDLMQKISYLPIQLSSFHECLSLWQSLNEEQKEIIQKLLVSLSQKGYLDIKQYPMLQHIPQLFSHYPSQAVNISIPKIFTDNQMTEHTAIIFAKGIQSILATDARNHQDFPLLSELVTHHFSVENITKLLLSDPNFNLTLPTILIEKGYHIQLQELIHFVSEKLSIQALYSKAFNKLLEMEVNQKSITPTQSKIIKTLLEQYRKDEKSQSKESWFTISGEEFQYQESKGRPVIKSIFGINAQLSLALGKYREDIRQPFFQTKKLWNATSKINQATIYDCLQKLSQDTCIEKTTRDTISSLLSKIRSFDGINEDESSESSTAQQDTSTAGETNTQSATQTHEVTADLHTEPVSIQETTPSSTPQQQKGDSSQVQKKVLSIDDID